MSGERVERKFAAILAADVAGYSRLMGADEEGTLAALKAIRRELGDPENRRASRPHRQDHRRRAAGRIRQRRRRGALRVEMQRGMADRNAEHSGRPAASNSASASMSATSSSMATTSTATASISRRGWRRWPSRAGYASRPGPRGCQRQDRDAASRISASSALKNIKRPVRVYRLASAGSRGPSRQPEARDGFRQALGRLSAR